MPTAENAILYYEAGQTAVALAALTNSGDETIYTSGADLWSNRSGYAPAVHPQGLASGCAITPAASGTNNYIDISAGTAYIDGVLTAIPADTDVEVTRATSTDTHIINSITIANDGSIAVEAGTDHASAFSTTRDADGGPPLITVDSIEIGWVMLTSFTAAAITAAEIFQVPGTHVERSDYPTWTTHYIRTASGALGYAGVTFASALPTIHTGPLPKEVWASYSTPAFAEVPNATDFVAAETSYSVSSTQVYGGTIGATSTSLGQGSFTAHMSTGVYEGFEQLKGQKLWFRHHPNRLNSVPCTYTNGFLGVARKWPAGDSITAACTISAESETVDVASE